MRFFFVLFLMTCFTAFIPAASAKVLSLDYVLSKSIESSYDLKLADVDKKLAKADSKIARADFFPTLTGSYNTQYSRALSNQFSQQQVAVVGNTVLPGATGFQHVYSLGLNYSLFDGGGHLFTYKAARRRLEASDAAKKVMLRDLKLNVAQLYTEALLDYDALVALRKALALHRQLYTVKRRMQESRAISKVELAEVALVMADADTRLQRVQESLEEKLHDISLFTKENYDIDSLEMEELPDTVNESQIRFEAKNTPDLVRFNKEIESKKDELKAIRAQALPQVSYYSNLIFYGSDRNDWGQAMFNTAPRQVYMGLNISMPIFDGMKNASLREKKKAEIERLTIERDKKMWELAAQAEKLKVGAKQYSVELQTSVQLLNTSYEKVSMVQKLNNQQLIDLSTLIHEQIAAIDHQVSLARAKTMRLSLLHKASIVTSM